MIKIKPGVAFHQNTFRFPQVSRIIEQAQLTCPPDYSPTITSGAEPDAPHKPNSKHWVGCAIDFRIKDLPDRRTAKTWSKRLQRRLGDEYLVLLEANHIHTQWNGLETST